MDENLRLLFLAYVEAIPDSSLHYILPEQLAQMREDGDDSVFILDNRTPEAFFAGHIPGSVNIWMKELFDPSNLSRIPRDKPVVVVCWVGHTASQLIPMLRMLGFDAVGMKYGMGKPKNRLEDTSGWEQLGLPIEHGF